jgi:hypothetical protein
MQCFGGRASDQLFCGRASDQPFIERASDQFFGGRENQINFLWKCIRSTFSLQEQHTVEPNSPSRVLVSALVIALIVTLFGALVGDSSILTLTCCRNTKELRANNLHNNPFFTSPCTTLPCRPQNVLHRGQAPKP